MSTYSRPAPSQTGCAERKVEATRAEQRAEIFAGLERALTSGIEQLNDIERGLANETEHFTDLRRRLCEAYHALHSAGPPPVLLLREDGTHERNPHERPLVQGIPGALRDVSSEIARAAAARTPDGELLCTVIHRLAPGADRMRKFRLPLPPAAFAEVEGVHLWPRVREAWREDQATLIAARRVLAESGVNDDQSVIVLRAAVEEHLSFAVQLRDESPWKVPGSDEHEASRVTSGIHTLDALVAAYLEKLGRDGSSLRGVGHQAAEEVRRKARERWASWENAPAPGPEGAPPWQRWRNRALFPTILARALWRGEVQSRVARARAKPPGTIYAVFRSITRVSASQLELGLDGEGRQAIIRRDLRKNGPLAVADIPALSEEIFTHGLKLLGSRYTLPIVEWLVERAHAQALDGADRPDVIEIEGGWEAFARAVLEKPVVDPKERAKLHSLVRMLASSPIRWQDGARSSSLFMLFENSATAGRGRGRSVIRFTLDMRLLEHEHHRARERFGPGAGPAQWADWRIVPLPRPRIIAPLTGSPRDTYGPQTVALRLLWLFFTRHGDQLLDDPKHVQIAPDDRRDIAEQAQLPTRFIDPLLGHFVRQGAIVASAGSRFAPADPAARAFIAEGWRRSRLASETGQRGSRAKAAGLRRGR